MNCIKPLYALDLGVLNPETHKRKIKILPKRVDQYNRLVLEEKYGKGNILSLPCGSCINCKINYSRSWALRCVCEASLYDDNWFITLTYDDLHNPGSLIKSDLQKFIKRLRKFKPGCRYFACGEYGETTKRPHFHLILFNLKLDDIRCIGKAPKGGYYYESKLIKDLWPFGFNIIGDVNYSSCNYVAQYCMKKVYKDCPDEFVLMSLKPGIGANYFKDNWKTIYDTDHIYIANGNRYVSSPPRYFDKLLDRVHPLLLDDIRSDRISRANSSEIDKLMKLGMQFVEQSYDVDLQIAINKMKERSKRR